MIAKLAPTKSLLLSAVLRGSLSFAALLGALISAPLTLVTSEASAQAKARKLALLIGIDHYGAKYQKGVALFERWSPLDGTVNDVTSSARRAGKTRL
jgi:hypothetical protein